ncbi:excisionase family DNA-binding protein [Pseudoclavibacter helvolus]|uniref:excisionase family DNA-binding protein n=1 Tax=Pseudoclavibacter helvolus TaxID=255205 RepID=UPI003C74E19E
MHQHTRTRKAAEVTLPHDLEQLADLSRFLEQHSAPAALLGPDGEQVPLPVEVYEILKQVAAAMRSGTAVSIESVERRLTTQQAANLLGISRPTLVRLLVDHEIPFETPTGGRHRRLRLQDVLDYRDRKRADRIARLDELTAQASEDGLYENSATDYTAELRAIRAGR